MRLLISNDLCRYVICIFLNLTSSCQSRGNSCFLGCRWQIEIRINVQDGDVQAKQPNSRMIGTRSDFSVGPHPRSGSAFADRSPYQAPASVTFFVEGQYLPYSFAASIMACRLPGFPWLTDAPPARIKPPPGAQISMTFRQ